MRTYKIEGEWYLSDCGYTELGIKKECNRNFPIFKNDFIAQCNACFFKDLYFSEELLNDLLYLQGISLIQNEKELILNRTLLLKNEEV